MKHSIPLVAIDRVIPDARTSAVDGVIQVDWVKTAWLFGHGLAGLTGVVLFPQGNAVLVFVVVTAITICAGHSVGMHRLLIHRSFKTPLWVEYIFIWLGTLVGMAGPMGMMKAHDMRDWHQRQTVCPPHPSHGARFWRDAWWQMCCVFPLHHPPRFEIEARVADDPVYRAIERTWMLQQVPLALVLFALGGWAFVLWGVSLRIFVSLVGHWMTGHFAHRSGTQGWRVAGLPVQGYNLPKLALITFGENWHGNHHAFPHSAKMGVEKGQMDPGYWFIRTLAFIGLAWDVKMPESEPARDGLTRV